MIKNPRMLEQFNRELLDKDKPDFRRNMKIYQAMYEWARELGCFPLEDPLEGIKIKIKIARVVNSV
ncbi:MAG: hypothetical protein GF315_12065 [candidate division Zixibacteria bacterium]|nr:hypothetical protein [candidate division Zixibacteria bacterium]